MDNSIYSKVNKDYKLYITIDELKKQIKADLEDLKDCNYNLFKYYKPVLEYVYNNLNSEAEIKEYLIKHYHYYTYTVKELNSMEIEEQRKLIQEDAACRMLYTLQDKYYNKSSLLDLK